MAGARAMAAGTALEETLWGRFLENVTPAMNQTYFPGAFTAEGPNATSACLLVWNATSQAFAAIAKGDVTANLLTGDTSAMSVFITSELNVLRAKQDAGIVNNIYINTLTPEAELRYLEMDQSLKMLELELKELTKQKTELEGKTGDITAQAEARALRSRIAGITSKVETQKEKIKAFIADDTNWQHMTLDKDCDFNLVVGSGKDKKHISYLQVKEAATRLKLKGSPRDVCCVARAALAKEKARQALNSFREDTPGQFYVQGTSIQLVQNHKSKGRKPAPKFERGRSAGTTRPSARASAVPDWLKSSKHSSPPKGTEDKTQNFLVTGTPIKPRSR